jgi:hypothetical protein
MKTALQILIPIMFFIFTACVTLYKPNAIHSPILKAKGEINTSASLGLSGSGLYNFQTAFAVSEHTGIIIDGMYHNRHISSADSSVEKLNIFFGEAGAGYFTTAGNKNRLFQCYSGLGYGSTSDRIVSADQSVPEVKAEYFNIFIQPGIAFMNKYFNVALDLRANYVHLFNIHAYMYDRFEFWNTDFKFFSDTTLTFVNLEPAVTIKSGGDKVKGVLQFGLTIPAINSKSYFDVNTSSMMILPLINFSLGINYTFGLKKQITH